MSDPRKHHFVPQFLMKPWLGADGRLQVFRRFASKIVKLRRAPEEVARERDLYSLSEETNEPDRFMMERDYFGELDRDAAIVTAGLLANEPGREDLRENFAEFLLAMEKRSPGDFSQMRYATGDYFKKLLENDQQRYSERRKADDPDLFTEYAEKMRPGIFKDLGVFAFKKAIRKMPVFRLMFDLTWYTVDTSHSSRRLLLSDRPMFRVNGLGNPDAVICMPISPQRCFFAFRKGGNVGRALQKASVERLVRAINLHLVSNAITDVYGVNESDVPDGFLHKHLADSHNPQTILKPLEFSPKS